MLHLHFGAGRLGLGLVVPFFQNHESEHIVLNRARSGSNETGTAGLSPERKAELLSGQPDRVYVIQTPGAPVGVRDKVRYTNFATFNPPDVRDVVRSALDGSRGKSGGVVVTASVLKAEHYGNVVHALNEICMAKRRGEKVGDIFLVACENTVSAQEVLTAPILQDQILPETREYTRCAEALVDRMCVALEEYPGDSDSITAPTVLVRAEEYGSLKLEQTPATEPMVDLCKSTGIQFSKHLEMEKKIKGWLLNGTHWLIALTAFEASGGDTNLKLNEYLQEHPDRQQFAAEVIREIGDGIELLIQNEAACAQFRRDVNVHQYLEGAEKAILQRFLCTQDTISRILARFREPSPDEVTSIQSFVRRFFDRVDPAIAAYEAAKGMAPPATSRGLISLFRLVATGTFVNNTAA